MREERDGRRPVERKANEEVSAPLMSRYSSLGSVGDVSLRLFIE